MTARTLILPAAVVLALACRFAVSQRALNEVRSENESLRQQIEAQTNAVASETPAETPAAITATALTVEEKHELLRLRGQVPTLRRDVAEASNRIAGPTPTERQGKNAHADMTPELRKENEALVAFMDSDAFRSADELARALRLYLQEHGGQIPTDLSAVLSPGNSAVPEGAVQRFELLRTGAITDDAPGLAYVVVAREKTLQQLSDGRWVRLFIRANGGLSVIPVSPDNPDESEFLRNMENARRHRSNASR